MSVLLLSDLHLPSTPSALRQAFIRFLEGPARNAESVYILGDLFEYWIGDDAGLEVYAQEIAALAALCRSGVPVRVMRGNRDFLFGKQFCRHSGASLLADPAVREIGGVATLLSHGDLFCTDDRAYQRWRAFSRNALAQSLFARLSRARRERIAGGLRSGSSIAKRQKPEAIMDVNESEVRRWFQKTQVLRMVHGHTHRPALHRYEIGERNRERIVLADWHEDRCEYLQIDEAGMRRVML